jgi:uncharacterized protein YbbC (DUF1343 family)
VKVGLDKLGEVAPLLGRLRAEPFGLLVHAASVDRALRHATRVLAALGARPARLFAPEHGLGASAQDMVPVPGGRDAASGIETVSLYGARLEDLVPRPAHLGDLRLFVVDLADVGARYYTFVWTALLAARAAAAAGVHVVVLDRPNPLSGLGESVEGRLQRDGFTSFVGWEKVPIRHALTLGEMVALFMAADGAPLGPDGALGIVGVEGWERAALASRWDRPFVQPSPNMPTLETALVYPGGCLIEGTNLSEGRGHTRPFEHVGAPWIDGERLADDLAGVGLPGFTARPVVFVPTFHKHAGLACGGVQIHVTDARAFRPVATYAALVALARAQDPARFRFRTERYEYVDDIPAFDLLTGSDEARHAIEAGAAARDVARLVSDVEPGWRERMREAEALARRAAW